MKNLIALLSFAVVISATANAHGTDSTASLKWYTNLDEVHNLSAETGKPIFGFFTGSDWCGWCIKLQREVFAKPLFIEWAQANVILLELDYPRKTPQDEALKTQNRNLQQAFQVTGYPTVWIFRSTKDATTGNYNLTSIGKLGYPSGAVVGQEEVKFLETANGILAKDTVKPN